jgi:hypothetical protein
MWRVLAVLLTCALSACADTTAGVRTQFFGTYPFSPTERRTIARIAGAAALEARQHLPALASQITLEVHSGKDVIPELGATAVAGMTDWIRWTVDPDHPGGVVKIAEAHLRGALFHEFHHLVRGTTLPPQTEMDRVVFEQMATAFERDFAGVSQPPGQGTSVVDQAMKRLGRSSADLVATPTDEIVAAGLAPR